MNSVSVAREKLTPACVTHNNMTKQCERVSLASIHPWDLIIAFEIGVEGYA